MVLNQSNTNSSQREMENFELISATHDLHIRALKIILHGQEAINLFTEELNYLIELFKSHNPSMNHIRKLEKAGLQMADANGKIVFLRDSIKEKFEFIERILESNTPRAITMMTTIEDKLIELGESLDKASANMNQLYEITKHW